MYQHLLSKLNSNSVVLTPNRRLAATVHKLYQQQQQQSYWLTPDILPLSTWVQRLWKEYTSKEFFKKPLLLTPTQEIFIWEKIINQSTRGTQLLRLSETAELARSAWNTLQQWEISLDAKIFETTQDYLALQYWGNEFITYCRQGNVIDNASLLTYLNAQLQKIELPQHIYLLGFTELTPQLNTFLTTCKQNGCEVTSVENSSAHASVFRISVSDHETEILSMARWAKQKLAENSKSYIGCVIPSLDKIRSRVFQLFSEVFSTENNYHLDTKSPFFNISAGKPLSQFPIIHAALQLLQLQQSTISADKFSFLLTSAFIGGAESERLARAKFDSQLKWMNIHTSNLMTVVNNSTTDLSLALQKSCPVLFNNLKKFYETQPPSNALYSEWVFYFNDLLNILGWPGERSLNSEEYQVVESWYELLNTFTTLDQVGSAVNFQSALNMLHLLAKKTVFQPQTPEAPIQVLGMLEAASIPFDYVWVSGMDDLKWPPQPQPNPFIPKSLQNQTNMPHANAQRELMFCQNLIQQFKNSSQKIIFSHAEKDESLELNPSPLIREYPSINLENLNLPNYIPPAEKIFASKQIELLQDDAAPPMIDTELMRGGVTVLKQQALCPFKAFAEWRLHTRELEPSLPGLRAKDRGTILHKSLELIWKNLKDQATLLSYSEEQLAQLITESVDAALALPSNSRKELANYIYLEKKRLQKLITDWLEIEKTRPPFKVIHQESLLQITLNKLNLTTRVDRIDELDNQKKLIIDYKTGKNNEITRWFSERPEEPQLPLYALIDMENTIGISFAQLQPGNNCFKGVSRYDIKIKGLRDLSQVKNAKAISWDEQLAEWKKILAQLSNDFYLGKAAVNPKHPTQTCTWCALKPLCRIYEQSN